MDFDVASIDVVPATLAWGPYTFNFLGVVPDPDGDPIVSATVKSYRNGVETTHQLINSSQVASPVVKVWINYPGADLRGKHTLVFGLTAQSGGANSFQFGYVDVG
jgi:hypothetical protein